MEVSAQAYVQIQQEGMIGLSAPQTWYVPPQGTHKFEESLSFEDQVLLEHSCGFQLIKRTSTFEIP